MTAATPDSAPAHDEIVARPGCYYRNTRFIFVAATLFFAAYFAYDGWVAWPREAAMNRQDPKTGAPHSDFDIRLQKILACSLPPVGIALLAWTLYNSRGVYRLRGDVLSVPGHPDVPFDAIRAIDKSKWDRKGIAYVEYEVGGRAGRLRLDDFVYERQPTDKIMERVEAHVAPPQGFDVVQQQGGEGPEVDADPM